MVPVYNDEDIIEESLNNLIDQDIDPVVLDNGSTDGTYEICNKYFEKGKIKLEQHISEKFEWPLTIRKLYDLALMQSPDWVILLGSDEFPESGVNNLNLNDAISKVDSEGYNLIQFNIFNFFMTDNDVKSATTIRKKFLYYSYQNDLAYRAWKFYPGISPEIRGGHLPIFPSNYKYLIYPKKFVLRHYQFRSKEQAQKRIRERLSRIEGTAETKTGWHSHYFKIKQKNFFQSVNHKLLNKYLDDNIWNLEFKFSFAESLSTKKDDIFFENGSLKHPPFTLAELRLANKRKKEKIAKLENKIKENDK